MWVSQSKGNLYTIVLCPSPSLRSGSVGAAGQRFWEIDRHRPITRLQTCPIDFVFHVRVQPPSHTTSSRLHPLALSQESLRTPTQIHSFTQGKCSIDCGKCDLREVEGHNRVIISGRQPVGDYAGEGYCEKGGGCCWIIRKRQLWVGVCLRCDVCSGKCVDETHGRVYPVWSLQP